MSFIITVYTNEGIVMASDSRTTYTQTTTLPEGNTIQRVGIQTTDTTYKTFQCNKRIGLSTCGDASIQNAPITGYIEDFIFRNVTEDSTVEDVAKSILTYFSRFTPVPATDFIIAGYNKADSMRHIYKVNIARNKLNIVDSNTSGATWDGELEVFTRLVQNVAIINEDGTYTKLENVDIGFNYFTLQDAIDFAKYAVDVTIKSMAFRMCMKTVGGPIDVLVIKPDGAFWVQRKELHA